MKKFLLFMLTLLISICAVACMGSNVESKTSESFTESESVSFSEESELYSEDSEENSENSEESVSSSEDVEENSENSEFLTSYTVTFDTDGGSEVESLSVKEGEKIQKPEDPKKSSRDGEFEFVGWFYQGVEWNFENDVVTSDITLVAKWEVVAEYPPAVLPED